MGDRRHDPDERVRAAARARAVPVAHRRARGDRGRAWRGYGHLAAGRPDRARAHGTGGRSKSKPDEAAKPSDGRRAKPAAADAPNRSRRARSRPSRRWFRDLKPARPRAGRRDDRQARGPSTSTTPRRSLAPRSSTAARRSPGWPSNGGFGRPPAGEDARGAPSRLRSRRSSPARMRSSAPAGASSTTASGRSASWTSSETDRLPGGRTIVAMPAYLVVDVHRTDRERASRYSERSGPSVVRHGGRYLARGGTTVTLEGDWEPDRLVVIEFEIGRGCAGLVRLRRLPRDPADARGRR